MNTATLISKVKVEPLILGPYKEPLRKVKGGFGYMGALTFDTSSRVQCHICGELFDNLAGHALLAHKITKKQYKEKYGLAAETRLVSERFREEKKNQQLRYFARLSPEERVAKRKQAIKAMANANAIRRARIKAGTYKYGNNSLEQKNKRGICPDQLLDIIQKAHKHYGHTPSVAEFTKLFTQRYNEPIYRTFGSWSRALKLAKLPKRVNSRGYNGIRYSEEELLEHLSVFYSTHHKIPSATDCNRGLLPPYGTYRNRFGSFSAARRKAGVPDLIPNGNHPRSTKNKVTLLSKKMPV